MAATYSSLRAPRRSQGTPSASNSSCSQPTPRPNSKRPPDSWSRVASSFASTKGLRWGTIRMQVPKRSFGAAAAANASQMSGSGTGVSGSAGILPSAEYGYLEAIASGMMTCSPPHTDSKPAASARRQISSVDTPSIPMLLAKASPTFMRSPFFAQRPPSYLLGRVLAHLTSPPLTPGGRSCHRQSAPPRGHIALLRDRGLRLSGRGRSAGW